MYGLETWILNLLLPLFVIVRDRSIEALYRNADTRLRELGLEDGIEFLSLPRNEDGSTDTVLCTLGTPMVEGIFALAMAIGLHAFIGAVPGVYGHALFGTVMVYFTFGFINLLWMRQYSITGIRRSLVTDSTERLLRNFSNVKIRDIRAFVIDCAEIRTPFDGPLRFRRLSEESTLFLRYLPWNTGYDYENNNLLSERRAVSAANETTTRAVEDAAAGQPAAAQHRPYMPDESVAARIASAFQRMDEATRRIDSLTTATTGGMFGPVFQDAASPEQYRVTTTTTTIKPAAIKEDKPAKSADIQEKANTARRLLRNVDNNSTESSD